MSNISEESELYEGKGKQCICCGQLFIQRKFGDRVCDECHDFLEGDNDEEKDRLFAS